MPTYDYRCLSCDHKFHVLVSIKEKENVRCPVCESDQISQVFSGAGISVGNSDESSSGCGSGGWGFT